MTLRYDEMEYATDLVQLCKQTEESKPEYDVLRRWSHEIGRVRVPFFVAGFQKGLNWKLSESPSSNHRLTLDRSWQKLYHCSYSYMLFPFGELVYNNNAAIHALVVPARPSSPYAHPGKTPPFDVSILDPEDTLPNPLELHYPFGINASRHACRRLPAWPFDVEKKRKKNTQRNEKKISPTVIPTDITSSSAHQLSEVCTPIARESGVVKEEWKSVCVRRACRWGMMCERLSPHSATRQRRTTSQCGLQGLVPSTRPSPST